MLLPEYPPMTRDYFIAKFEAIPDEKWTTGKYMDKDGRCCALGHCGVLQVDDTADGPRYLLSKEGDCLQFLIEKLRLTTVHHVNDGVDPHYQQPTPKARILAALRDLSEE